MELTRKESSVVQRLRRKRVATMKTLRAAHDYGQPKRILHDLSSAISLACQ